MQLPLAIEGLVLRPFVPEDAADIARYGDNLAVWRNLRDGFPHPYTLTDAERWIAMATSNDDLHAFAIATPDEVIGGAGLHPFSDVHRLSAELGYWLGQEYWGRGIATAAVTALCHYAFDELQLVRLQAGVFEGNEASMRVLEKCGFSLEGVLRASVIKQDRLLNQHLYARIREIRE